MKRLIKTLLTLCLVSPALAQSTTVSGTVVDQGGQTWTNGTISYVIVPNPVYAPQLTWQGAALPTNYTVPTLVTLTGSGTFSFLIPDNTTVTPIGSKWSFVICPQASSACQTLSLAVSGSAVNISSQITAVLPALLISSTPIQSAYSSTQVQTPPKQGAIYYDTTAQLPYYYKGSSWTAFGSGGGGGTPGGSTGSFQYNNAGVFGGVNITGFVYGNGASAPTQASTAQTTTTINTQPCVLGSSCTITATPPDDIRFFLAAVSDGGTAFAADFTRYDNQQPQTGSDLPASSTSAYMAFQQAASPLQYAQLKSQATPFPWLGTSAYIQFSTTATTGNVTWQVATACVNAGGILSTPTFGTPVSVTTTVSGTAGALVTTAVLTNIAVPGTNGCVSGTTAPGSTLLVRINRGASDTAASDAHFYGMTLDTVR